MASSWQLGPVLRGIRGHRAAAVLVVVQLGIGLAITVLAALIGNYFATINNLPADAPANDLTLVELQVAGRQAGPDADRRRADVLAEVERAPGYASAALVGQPPTRAIERIPDDVRRTVDAPATRAYELAGGAGTAQVNGLRLHAGRDFVADDLRNRDSTAAIVSLQLARTMWPDRDPVGARFLSRAHGPAVVVGVVEDLRPHLFDGGESDVIYAKDDPRSPRMLLLVRSAAGRAEALRAALRERVRAPGQSVVVTPAVEYTRALTTPVSSVLGILAAMSSAMVLVILIGSMGLTYYLVAERTREIGLRRAMGATRRDVVQYFLVENMMLTGAGAVIGLAVVAIVLPTLFSEQDGFRVSWALVGIAVAAVLGLNLLATFIPARKAAAVPPIVASRTI